MQKWGENTRYPVSIVAAMALLVTPAAGEVCKNFGPQSPRDIDRAAGSNPVVFSMAPAASRMHLCNIHFHQGAEHRSKAFSIYAGRGHGGYGSGYMCSIGRHLSAAEKAWSGPGVCRGKHGELVPGDTIEVHWVYTTCDVPGGKGLGSCLSRQCANPQLRVEAQVFTLVAKGGLNFGDLQSAPPSGTGMPVQYPGSTTGPNYSQQICSKYQVSWSVRPRCAKLNIHSLGKWCKGNRYEEDHAQGVRALVTDPMLLSRMR
jgi:Delta carbonic anhydrase